LREQNNSMTERFEQGAEEGEGTGQWKKWQWKTSQFAFSTHLCYDY
jgi:hypothetical protein